MIKKDIQNQLSTLYGQEIPETLVQLNETRKDFEGDITLVVFPLLRTSKKGPEQTAEQIGEILVENIAYIQGFNVVKGFLNLVYTESYLLEAFNQIVQNINYGKLPDNKEHVMIEYSSPNTNKPLHLGHIRNNLLGYSVAEILKASGAEVVKTQIINDRGIHICKSMVAWQKFGEGKTPESTGLKGDKLVGDYYVKFDQAYKKEIADLMAKGRSEKEAKEHAPILLEAREMLQKWEANDPQVRSLWETMNGWVYKGFEVTYNTLGVDFDELYYESTTYITGKQMVEEGLKSGVFFKKEDGSVWCDLTDQGLDEKLVLRADGTAVYMTQDIGTAILRFKDFPKTTKQIYTVGNEQDYHFKVLFLIIQKLGYTWAKDNYHLSYGMMELPSGKMKSREGTVVDADDLMHEMYATAKATTEELGKLDGVEEAEKEKLYWNIGLGALKYFILKVDPKKKMMFNPEESIDFNGNTGPFIQYTHARTCAISRKSKELAVSGVFQVGNTNLSPSERVLLKLLLQYPELIKEAAKNYSPAIIANYLFELAKSYNQFYSHMSILREENKDLLAMRLGLNSQTSKVLKEGLRLLGIVAPERM